MTAKTHPRANRFIAALLAVFILVSVCAIGVYADEEDDLYQEYSAIYSEVSQLFGLMSDQQVTAYQALCQKYPNRPDIALLYADAFCYSAADDTAQMLAAYDHAIDLAQKSAGSRIMYVMYSSTDEILQKAYESKANIYLNQLYQQDNYIASMRLALDAEERVNRAWFDAGINTVGAVESLQKVQAKRAELDSIEQWYKAGSPTSFTAWNGRVQVTASADNRSVRIQMQTPGWTESEWAETADGDYVETNKVEYLSLSETFRCNAASCQPVSKVLRAIDAAYFVVPYSQSAFETEVRQHGGKWGAAYESLLTQQTIYYKADGTTKESSELEFASIGRISDFCSRDAISIPSDIRRYVETEGADSQDEPRIGYSVFTFLTAT